MCACTCDLVCDVIHARLCSQLGCVTLHLSPTTGLPPAALRGTQRPLLAFVTNSLLLHGVKPTCCAAGTSHTRTAQCAAASTGLTIIITTAAAAAVVAPSLQMLDRVIQRSSEALDDMAACSKAFGTLSVAGVVHRHMHAVSNLYPRLVRCMPVALLDWPELSYLRLVAACLLAACLAVLQSHRQEGNPEYQQAALSNMQRWSDHGVLCAPVCWPTVALPC